MCQNMKINTKISVNKIPLAHSRCKTGMFHFRKGGIILLLIFLTCSKLFAVTNYVSKTGYHVSPFTSWANAATNIQAAINAATSGDTVLVTNGTYYPATQISVTKNITVKSVNGAEKTIVDGGFPAQTNRCFYINDSNAIDGFTIVNGYAYGGDPNYFGGGVYCYYGGTIQNCYISENSASFGGGVYCNNTGTIQNCTIYKNSVSSCGGGISGHGFAVQNSYISENSASFGGGIYCSNTGTIQNCTINGNFASTFSAGIYCYGNSLIFNCIISKNSHGGGAYCDGGAMVLNCTISENSSSDWGGVDWGGVYCDRGGTVKNSILWNNTGLELRGSSSVNIYNCIENWTNLVNGNISNNPQFVSSSDFHLQATSPCINTGTNLPYVYTTTDLDGSPRLFGDRVDMGAYEFVPEPFSIIFYQLTIFGLYFIRQNK